MTKWKSFAFLTSASILLTACGARASANDGKEAGRETDAGKPAAQDSELSRVEKGLLNQITCARPPQAAIAMTAMLRKHLIAETEDGGDGIRLFVPVASFSLLGFPVVRVGGWQPGPDGAMAPFYRGPGTSPSNQIIVTVKATEEQVRRKLASLGISEMRYEPDYSSNAWTDSQGEIHQPQRKVPGPEVTGIDGDGLVRHPLTGVTTIKCSAEDSDFEKDAEAQFG